MGVPAEEKAKIDELYPVTENGMVNLPFIGEIRAAGLESHQLAKAIEKAYRDGEIYQNLTIAVFANEGQINVADQRVWIGGEVKAAGARPFVKELTLFQAVQAAGGPTEFGAMNRVVLFREGKQQEINLQKAEGKAVIAMPNDTIEVPQKGWDGR